MDLLTKVVVSAVVIVAALFALYYGMSLIPRATPTPQQVAKNITEYLNMLYPGANVTITDIKPWIHADNWSVLASVIENSTTPCPVFNTYSFEYPAFGLVNNTPNKYTAANCTIYSGAQVGSFPVAVALASKNSTIARYISNFGFANVVTSAIAYNVTISGRVLSLWNVTYSSRRANYSMYALLSQLNGSILKTSSKSK